MLYSKANTVLLVEDDADIINLLTLHLHNNSYCLTTSPGGIAALQTISTNHFDLILLDIMLPDIDGLEICRRIRALNITTPVIMLTSRSEEIDKVLALELGADDYLTKPFSIRELQARIKAVLRRTSPVIDSPAITQEISIKGLYINKEKRLATVEGKRLELTAKEFDLLFLLASHAGQTFSRKQILEHVWGYSFSGYEHTVTSHINRLRLKLEQDLQHPEYILTAWGTGYRFTE